MTAKKNSFIKDSMNEWLGSLGFFFPSSKVEMETFDQLYQDFDFELTGSEINPMEIIGITKSSDSKMKLASKSPGKKLRPFDYYKRILLASEIVYQLRNEPTLGHVKLQKLIYLCKHSSKMALPTNFLRQAMGPYDPQMMRSLDKQLEKKEWFKFDKTELLKYKPLANCGNHADDFKKYFRREEETIQYIINLLRKSKTSFVEIVGTLYACNERIIQNNEKFSESLLLEEFYAWSLEKEKYKEKEVLDAYHWMKEVSLMPK